MSSVSGARSFPSPPAARLWPLIHCNVCLLPFFPHNNPSNPPPVPFWMTECGHVICNAHLRSDQTCAFCNAASARPVPLQAHVRLPFRAVIHLLKSDQTDPHSLTSWHLFIPQALSQLASAAQYQHESTSRLLYALQEKKERCERQETLLQKIKPELESLKATRRQVDILQRENQELRKRLGMDPAGPPLFPSPPRDTSTSAAVTEIQEALTNGNGKRPYHQIQTPVPVPMIRPPSIRPPTSAGHSGSSERSFGGMPTHPERLTLPAREQGAGFGVRAIERNITTPVPTIQQFGYVPPATPTHFAPPIRPLHTPIHTGHRQDWRFSVPYPPNPAHNGNMGPPPTPVHRRAPVGYPPQGAAPPGFPLPTAPQVARPQTAPITERIPQPQFTPQQQHVPAPFHSRTNLPSVNVHALPSTPRGQRLGNIQAERSRKFVPAAGKPNSNWTPVSSMGQ
ncbi:hypothetical protein CALCODRAFT_79375 [Calocera cornea HHB12733]|uniref:RING-type domain-containing protein n=1 Tax=Calocera cornea HHB12733 TaxID=1353952 RepID=A0A165DF68_9BASI|nr:hypothetical protein CALCODRAFT_79375 [Calocera cornea HHB12733]